MELKEFENRNLIFESKWKTIALTFISLTFVILALTLQNIQSNSFMFWITIILFGSGVVLGLFKLLNPKNLFLAPYAELTKKYHKMSFEKAQKEDGIFSYNTDGFIVQTDNETKTVKWNEIKTMFGYKKDHYTYDNICLDIFLNDNSGFSVNEETKGWFQFLDRTKNEFSSINKSWEIEISMSVFETKMTLIYDKDNRQLEDAEKEHYKD